MTVSAAYVPGLETIWLTYPADEAMFDRVLRPLVDEPKILEDHHFTWTVDNWRSRPKRERGPKFYAGGHPW